MLYTSKLHCLVWFIYTLQTYTFFIYPLCLCMDRRCGISIDSFVINRNESSFRIRRFQIHIHMKRRIYITVFGWMPRDFLIQVYNTSWIPNLFCVICTYILVCLPYYTTTTGAICMYLDVRWAVSLYYTNVLIQMTHLHSNVLQLAIEFSGNYLRIRIHIILYECVTRWSEINSNFHIRSHFHCTV